MERTKHLKAYLDSWRDFVGYIQVIGYWKENLENDLIPDKETSFFVFVNEPSSTFSLKNHLLLLARLFNQEVICLSKRRDWKSRFSISDRKGF